MTLLVDTRNDSNFKFDFNAEHNGVACIASLKPEDAGTERQFWFTAKMLSECFECKTDTIRARVETLANTGDLDETKNLVSLSNVQCFGYNTTTLYDLTVFNKLAMTFIDNERAVEIRRAFNDVIVKEETKNLSDQEILAKALVIANATLAKRDERITELMAENEDLKTQIGDSTTYKAAQAITWVPDYFDLSKGNGLYISLASNLKKVLQDMAKDCNDENEIKQYEPIDIADSRHGTVKAYHVDVIERLHEMIHRDPRIMAKYRKALTV